MKTTALRLYGKNDARLESFELPPIGDDEILAKVVSDSLCMSTYKAIIQGADHKRIPNDVAENPVMLGHEFCGEIVEVGKKWRRKYKKGERFAIQPALNYRGRIDAPGYSYPYIGGCATYIIIPNEVMEADCLLPYSPSAFFYGSLAEPVSCVIGSFHEFFHAKAGVHRHKKGIKKGGSLAILAGCGPMGLCAIGYILNAKIRPSVMTVTDISEDRLNYASRFYSPEYAAERGVRLNYINTSDAATAAETIKGANGGNGYDDVLAMAPVPAVVEQGSDILGRDGCLSFFAGPTDPKFKASVNFYDIHYNGTHYVGTVGGNSDDMREALDMMASGLIDPTVIVTHVGGLNAARDSSMNLPKIPGGKKLIYTHADMPLTAIADFAKLGETDERFAALHEITARNNGLWCEEAEKYVLEHFVKGEENG